MAYLLLLRNNSYYSDNIYIGMPLKKSKKEKNLCSNHAFTLSPTKPSCYYQRETRVNLCRREQFQKEKKTESNCYEGPLFNKDKNCDTPSFILASDKVDICLITEELSNDIDKGGKWKWENLKWWELRKKPFGMFDDYKSYFRDPPPVAYTAAFVPKDMAIIWM